MGTACCFYFLLTGNLLGLGFLIIPAGFFDLLDEAVVQALGKTTKFGILSGCHDRPFFEVGVAISVAYETGYKLLLSLCTLGDYSIGYAKARAAMEIPIKNNEWPDFIERAERGLLFALHLTVVQRVWRAYHLIRKADTGDFQGN